MTIPKALSPGEELLAVHLRSYDIPFKREVRLIDGRKWTWDYVVSGTIAVEVQGQVWRKGGHSTGQGITRDCEKGNAATVAGYRVLNFTTEMVESGEAIDTIRAALGMS